jgi:hypothetical protein
MRRMGSLRQNLLPFVSPPVAAARYLRARAGLQGLHITYVGDCPGAADPAIDRYATPAALLRSLAKRSINPASQSTTMDERVARDGRRFYSLPGGAPAPNWIYAERRGPAVLEPESADYIAEVANHVAKRERCVLDIATRLGCACSGAVVGAQWSQARAAISAMEPERAVHEVLDHELQVDVAAMLEPWTGTAEDGDATPATSLSTLAANFDPTAKAPPVREPPSSPVPFPQPKPIPRKSGPSVVFVEPEKKAEQKKVEEKKTGGWDGVDRRKWNGVERREGWTNGKPPGFVEPRTAGPPREPRTMPVRQTHTFIRVPSTAGDRMRTIVVSVLLSVLFGSAAAVVIVKYAMNSRPTVVQQAPAAPSDSVVLSASDTSPVPLPADPVSTVQRAPVGLDPAQVPRSRRRHDQPQVNTGADSTAATVYRSGAAPIPRASGPGVSAPAPAAQDISMRDSAASLRADIAARRHRVDSLAHVVDSLGKPK